VAISQRAAGTWAAVNATTQTVTIPVGSTAGDMMVMHFACKPFSASPSINQGWTVIGTHADGAVANGNGVGSVRAGIAYKIHTGSESNPVVTWGATAAPGIAVIVTFQKGAGESWATPTTVFGNVNSSTSINVTLGSDPGVTSGDMCLAGFYTRNNSNITTPSFTQTGVTYGTRTEYPAAAIATTSSEDMAGDSVYRLASSGTSSAAPALTASQAAAETGVLSFTRLRVSTGTSASAENVASTGAASNALGQVTINAGHASATGAASDASVAKVDGIGHASATAAANDVTAIGFSAADETDATLGKLQLGTAGLGDVVSGTAVSASAEASAATGAASTAAAGFGVNAGNAAATGAAGDSTVSKVDGIGAVSATGSAFDAGNMLITCFSTAGEATAAAHDVGSITVRVNAEAATATAAASNIVLGAGAQAIPATAAAYDGVPALGVNAEHVAATGAASSATIQTGSQTTAQAGQVSVTAAVTDIAAAVKANAGNAAAIAEAWGASLDLDIEAGQATAVGSAYDVEAGQFELEAIAPNVAILAAAYDAAIVARTGGTSKLTGSSIVRRLSGSARPTLGSGSA
jgi:hypothetical protein